MPNRLERERSPYLRQHKDNPIDWHPWGDDAFEKARKENRPVFLSVGYSSCHWCHVMAHESFENEELAEILNRGFVSIKVDREERPDVDETYMTAVQLSSGHGGWPMSVFMTPDRKPFFAGTYFPLKDRGSHPGFLSIVKQIEASWLGNRDEIASAAAEFANALTSVLDKAAPTTHGSLDEKFLETSIREIASLFDPKHGGFGEKPKFPPHGSIELLLNYALRPQTGDELREVSLTMALATLSRMCAGGIHDHVGGGFHRYSTDERWLVPHFEKMLYDNALMLRNLVHASAIAGQLDSGLEAQFVDAAQGIVEWLEREMSSAQGLFFSAVDADSDGEEGKFYVWSTNEVRQLLGERAAPFMNAYGFEERGNFEDEASGKRSGFNIPFARQVKEDFSKELELLMEAREARTKPGIDTKAIVSWNGLMLGALVDAGRLGLAERGCEAILNGESKHGRLPHFLMDDEPIGDAFLDDYAAFIDALLRLAGTSHALTELSKTNASEMDRLKLERPSREPEYWLGHAKRLADEMISGFYDANRGGFFFTGERHERLFGRTKPVFDQPVPSGNALAVRCLLSLGYADLAAKTVQGLLGWMQRMPHGTASLLLAALPLVSEASIEATNARPPISADVQVFLSAKELHANESGRVSGEVVMRVPEGFHVNGPKPEAVWLVPTLVTIEPLKFGVDYPDAVGDEYTGEVRIPFHAQMAPEDKASEFEVRVRYQACTGTECLERQERVLTCVALR